MSNDEFLCAWMNWKVRVAQYYPVRQRDIDMGIGHRIFIVDGDSVEAVPQKAFRDFYFERKQVFPQYAERTLTFAVVILANEKRRPQRVIHIDAQRNRVRADGSLDRSHSEEGLRLAVNRSDKRFPQTPGTGTAVVDARARFDARRWAQLHPELSGPALKKILDAIFPPKRLRPV